MRDFKRNNRSGGRNRGDRPRFNSRGRGDRFNDRPQMYRAICAECGKQCEIPFRPSGDRPVYCSDCFEAKGGSSGRRDDRRDFGRRSDSRSQERRDKEMFSAICDSCGKSCEVPFRPTSGKPVYCDSCFNKKDDISVIETPDQSEEFQKLHDKLDKVLLLLTEYTNSKTVRIVKNSKSKAKSSKKVVTKIKTKKEKILQQKLSKNN